MKFKTKVGKYEEIKDSQPSPQNRQKVYFTCHSDDFDKYFDEITNEILSRQPNNTCIYFYDEETDNEEERDFDLNQMILFVIPVTYNFIRDDDCQARKDFKFAEENSISMLLLQQDYGLEEEFNRKCGEYQMLSKFPSLQNSQFYDPTAITYEEKLTKYLESKILGDELVKEIQQAFDAYIFLSYRKKDRKYAQELMKLIHSNDFCRDIAIWYDEFLVSGEDFNEAIKAAMEKSNLFSMVVTPNLINEENYVQSTEYPAAKKAGKPVFPAESVPTDRGKLKELYPDIPDAVSTNGAEFSDELLNAIHKIAIKENDKDPKHNYLIGLAYLNGIDVEKNTDRGYELIESAAKAGIYEAQDELFNYCALLINRHDMKMAMKVAEEIKWLFENSTRSDIDKASSKTNLSSSYVYFDRLDDAKKMIEDAINIYMNNRENDVCQILLAQSYSDLAEIYRKRKQFDKAINELKESLKIIKEIIKVRPEAKTILIYDYLILADYYFKMNQFEECEVQTDEAYICCKDLLNECNETYTGLCANILSSIGDTYRNIGKWDKAKELFTEAVDIYESFHHMGLQDHSENYANTLAWLANIYRNDNRNDVAEDLLRKALNIYAFLDINNPDSTVTIIGKRCYIDSCNSLASFYLSKSEIEEAYDLFSASLHTLLNIKLKQKGVFVKINNPFSDNLYDSIFEHIYKELAQKGFESSLTRLAELFDLYAFHLSMDRVIEHSRCSRCFSLEEKTIYRILIEKKPSKYLFEKYRDACDGMIGATLPGELERIIDERTTIRDKLSKMGVFESDKEISSFEIMVKAREMVRDYVLEGNSLSSEPMSYEEFIKKYPDFPDGWTHYKF